MKNRSLLLTFLILLLCLSLLCGCQKKPKLTVGALSGIPVRDDLGITLTANSGSPTAVGGEFTLYNDSDVYYHYGDDYFVEVRSEDSWHELETTGSAVFNLILHDLTIYEPHVLTCGWSGIYGELPAGEYRLVKEIFYADYPENEDSFYVTCEFTIQ